MNVFERIFGKSFGSASVAKRRLQLVLTQDRTNISPETLNIIKDEIIAAISKHVEIDAANVQVVISSSHARHQLTADIPVIGTRTLRPRSKSKA